MNRPIKFKAWDGEKLREPEIAKGLIAFDVNGEMIGITDEVVLMQFTGLLDRNGKEIFEGDIVDACLDSGMGSTFHDKAEVFFHEHTGAWEIRSLKQKDAVAYLVGTNPIEVIGNIYENPDLLTY